MLQVNCLIHALSLNGSPLVHSTPVGSTSNLNEKGMRYLAHMIKNHMTKNFNSLHFSTDECSSFFKLNNDNQSYIRYECSAVAGDWSSVNMSDDELVNYLFDFLQKIINT